MTTPHRLVALRRVLGQALAALAVGAGGYATLGTTDCSSLFTIDAECDVVLAPGQEAGQVRVRVSPASFWSLNVRVAKGATLVQVEPPPSTNATGGVVSLPTGGGGPVPNGIGGSPELLGTGATAGAAVGLAGSAGLGESSRAEGGFSGDAGGRPLSVAGWAGSLGGARAEASVPAGTVMVTIDSWRTVRTNEYRFRVERPATSPTSGTFTTVVASTLGVMDCYHPPEMDLRVDVIE